jgi:hypothetical protein
MAAVHETAVVGENVEVISNSGTPHCFQLERSHRRCTGCMGGRLHIYIAWYWDWPGGDRALLGAKRDNYDNSWGFVADHL